MLQDQLVRDDDCAYENAIRITSCASVRAKYLFLMLLTEREGKEHADLTRSH